MDYTYDGLGEFFTLLGGFLILFLAITLPIFIIFIIGKVKFYQKAGKSGWEAIVPFYNDWVYVEIAGLAWWWFLILSASIIASLLDVDNLESIAFLVVLFGSFCCNYNISKKLHKDTGFAVLMTLFPFIMFPIVGFSSNYQFDQNVPVSDIGPFGKTDGVNVDGQNSSTKTHESTSEKDHKENDSSDVIYCHQCGKQVSKENSYCDNCGTKLK